MQIYWYFLLVIVFINILFTFLTMDNFARSMMQGNFDIYSLMFIVIFVVFLTIVFRYMLMLAEKSLLI